MLVRAMIRTKPNTEKAKRQQGDLLYFWPLDAKLGTKTMRCEMSVVVDINVPCGELFNTQPPACNYCDNNDVTLCDVIKYTKAKWTAGDIDNPPEMTFLHRHYIDISTILSADSLALAEKIDKTEEEKTAMEVNGKKTTHPKTIIQEHK